MSEPTHCPDCGFEAKSDFGLQAHHRSRHGPDARAPKQSPAPEPPPAPDGGTRRFRCKRYPKQILAPGGREIGRFVDGELETGDPAVVELCKSLEYVEEVTK